MALSTYTYVFSDILDNREQFEQDTERAISEMADSLCPIYTADIVAEWTELPSDKSDVWQDLTVVSNDSTITSLMTLDLYSYYLDLVTRAWAEVEETHSCEVALPNGVEISPSGTMATCVFCGFKSALWECACELEHDCQEEA